MKKVTDILQNLPKFRIVGDDNREFSRVVFDSRQVKMNDMFVAVRGTQADGHKFIDMALEKGASVIVCQDDPGKFAGGVTYIITENSSEALGIIASNYFNNPSEKLKLVGVTGTNGKTTIVTLLYHLFEKLGHKAGLLSTVCNLISGKELPASHTTPDAVQINNLLAEMVEQGCEYAFMEASSHAIDQNRISGLHFAGGIFTNLTHDHLDYHSTFDEYLRAKKKFFDHLDPEAFALINSDDKNGRVMLQNTKAVKKTYALKSLADFKVKIMESHFDGMLINIDEVDLWSKLIGEFNAYNILSVYSAAMLLGEDKDEILKILSTLKTVSGRFEYIRSNTGITAIVDYAHTPDALKNILKTINQIRTGNEQLITVVGAGGNRDKTKRPKMAAIAAEGSTKLILTSDNPRFEEPEAIIEDMLAGVDINFRKNTLAIVNRKEAIKTACMMAAEGDIILVAGKGHEDYQEIKGVKSHFSDKEIISEVFMLNHTNLQ